MNQIIKQVTAPLVLVLAGCVVNNTPTLADRLMPYVGKPMEVIMGRIGPPDDERSIAGKHVFTWSVSHMTAINLSGGMIDANCRIQITVSGPDNLVQGFSWYGNPAGCRSYNTSLK